MAPDGAEAWASECDRGTCRGRPVSRADGECRDQRRRRGRALARVPAPVRFFEYESRHILEREGIPVAEDGFATDAEDAKRDRRRDRRPRGHQVAGADRRPHEGRRRQVRRHARGGRGPRARHPRARDQRPHAQGRAGRRQGRDQAGVLRRRHLRRHRQEADVRLLRHGRDRHRGGRRDASRAHRARPLLDDPARTWTSSPRTSSRPIGITGHRPQQAHPDPLQAREAVRQVRHDARRDQPAGAARRRHVRRRRRAHGHGERGAGRARRRCSRSSASATRRRARRASPPSSRSRARRSTPWTTAAWPATSPSSTATSAS